MAVTLLSSSGVATRSWSLTDFTGTNGFGYLTPKTPDVAGVPAFPDGIFSDFLTTLSTIQGPGAISTSALTPTTGNVAFTLPVATNLYIGSYYAYSASTPTAYMVGSLAATVTASLTVTLAVAFFGGSGSHSDWIIAPLPLMSRAVYNPQASTYAVLITDLRAVVTFTGAAPTTWTLTALSSLLAGFEVTLINGGTAAQTINTGGGNTIFTASGAVSSIALTQGQAVTLYGATTSAWLVRNAVGYGTPSPAPASPLPAQAFAR